MLELMNDEAISVGAKRRREVLADTMKSARGSSFRHAAGVALVAIGRRVAGDVPAASIRPADRRVAAVAVSATGTVRSSARRAMQTTGDCI
jgi:hypothetical protein